MVKGVERKMMIKAFKMRLEYGMGPEYERRHAEVWPEVEQKILRATGVFLLLVGLAAQSPRPRRFLV